MREELLPDCMKDMVLFFNWLKSESVDYACEYKLKLKLAGAEWFKFSLSGHHIRKVNLEHSNAHWSKKHHGFHGTTPNALVEILKHGGLKEGSVHVESHCPWAVLLWDDRVKCAASSYAAGAIVEVIVMGHRNAYNTVRARPIDDSTRDWRDSFLKEPGRIITWKGSMYCKADATELVNIYVKETAVATLGYVSFNRSHKRR